MMTQKTNSDFDKNIKCIHVNKSNEFMGINIQDGIIKFYVPGAFREEDEKTTKSNLLRFLQSLNFVNEFEKNKIQTGDLIGNSWPIDSFLWIIHDFLENGYFYNREKIYFYDRKGKIDWKRTLRTNPIISDGNIIYDKLVTSKMSASNDIVAQIYRVCLSIAVKKIGWAFNYRLNVEAQQLKSKLEMHYIIKKEFSSTFDDIKRLRFKHMLKIIDGIELDDALSNEYTYGVKNYYYVFEKMVDLFFKGIQREEKKKYNPSGYWKLNGEDVKSSSLRPDTIYKHNNEVFIIDAKMYQYCLTGSINDLPTTSSMNKQITYGDYVRNQASKGSEVRNSFILPYNKNKFDFQEVEKCKDDNLVYIGYSYTDWRNNVSEYIDHEYIFTFLIDFNYLLNNYDRNQNYIDEFCEKINAKLREIKNV